MHVHLILLLRVVVLQWMAYQIELKLRWRVCSGMWICEQVNMGTGQGYVVCCMLYVWSYGCMYVLLLSCFITTGASGSSSLLPSSYNINITVQHHHTNNNPSSNISTSLHLYVSISTEQPYPIFQLKLQQPQPQKDQSAPGWVVRSWVHWVHFGIFI